MLHAIRVQHWRPCASGSATRLRPAQIRIGFPPQKTARVSPRNFSLTGHKCDCAVRFPYRTPVALPTGIYSRPCKLTQCRSETDRPTRATSGHRLSLSSTQSSDSWRTETSIAGRQFSEILRTFQSCMNSVSGPCHAANQRLSIAIDSGRTIHRYPADNISAIAQL